MESSRYAPKPFLSRREKKTAGSASKASKSHHGGTDKFPSRLRLCSIATKQVASKICNWFRFFCTARGGFRAVDLSGGHFPLADESVGLVTAYGPLQHIPRWERRG